ncbi:hypothetical protein [Paraburkholderia sp. J41]|uniref:hypothetical protein n=1 Tax=Paraburkholderia sp. J41 TaxID=2805433 RepID=UPI002AC3411A|nr:hypothetical protein [Paraburkholderia sp. J41]
MVQHTGDRVLVLKDGRAAESGETTDGFAAPQAGYMKPLLRPAPGSQREGAAAV